MFLREQMHNTHLAAYSLKILNPLSLPFIILACLYNKSKAQDWKVTDSLLVLLVYTFDKVIDE